jgi:hypothetical protein
VAAITLILAVPVRAEGPEDAKAIIAKGIQALGGEANLAKARAITFKEKGTFYGLGNPLPYTGEWSQQPPRQSKMVIEGAFTSVYNGDKGWINEGGTTRDLSKEELAEAREEGHATWVTLLLPLVKEPGFTLTAAGADKVEGKPAVGVKVAHAGYRDVTLYFDKDSGLPVKSVRRVKEQGGNEVTEETLYGNHKAIDGVQFAMKVVVKHDGKPYVEGEIVEVKFHPKLEDSVFARP